MNWSVIFEPGTLALYGEGLLMTLQLTFYSLGIGAVLALLFWYAQRAALPPLPHAATGAQASFFGNRRAWLLVDAMNRCWTDKLVEATAGGAKDRGARLLSPCQIGRFSTSGLGTHSSVPSLQSVSVPVKSVQVYRCIRSAGHGSQVKSTMPR